MAYKLKSRITQPILNENTIHKLIHDLWATIYNIPNTIEAIAKFEIRPFLKLAVMESATFRARRRETDEEARCRRSKVTIIQLKHARITRFRRLLWTNTLLQQLRFLASISPQSCSTETWYHLQIENSQRKCTKNEKILMKMSQKCYGSFEQNERDERIFFVNFSVRLWKVISV